MLAWFLACLCPKPCKLRSGLGAEIILLELISFRSLIPGDAAPGFLDCILMCAICTLELKPMDNLSHCNPSGQPYKGLTCWRLRFVLESVPEYPVPIPGP